MSELAAAATDTRIAEYLPPRTGIVRGGLDTALAKPQEESIRSKVCTFRPLRDQVLVRRVKEDEQIGGIWIPDAGKEKPMEGVVLAHGRGCVDRAGVFVPSELQTGDRVLFGRYAGTEYQLNGEAVLLLKESQIDGVIG